MNHRERAESLIKTQVADYIPRAHDRLRDRIESALKDVERETIERCAKVAYDMRDMFQRLAIHPSNSKSDTQIDCIRKHVADDIALTIKTLPLGGEEESKP